MAENSLFVDSPVGRERLDTSGSAVAVVRMDPSKAYAGVPELLKSVIDESSARAWENIKAKIDYIYVSLARALSLLEKETGFSEKVKAEVSAGKKLLFKPNLVNPSGIDPLTHGEGNAHSACTDWTVVAALMRWFHDELGVDYFNMMLGEAASATAMAAGIYTNVFTGGRKVTTEAVIEGRCGDFYGGWGFYFVRKYLAEVHPSSHGDNPMNGYEESIAGTYLPPGRAGNRLMVYDLNRTHDVAGKCRTVPVPEGANFKEITLHKVVVGGDPADPDDRRDYPGCVLINVPRCKIHNIDLITNAVKNLGIGLYPMEAEDEGAGKAKWKYAFPFRPVPGMKTEIPHQVWVPKIDDSSGLPLRDDSGRYITTKTAGMAGTQADVIAATMNQGVFMLHVVDAIQIVNLDHMGVGLGVKVNEGLVLTSLDPVALDLCCARYLFKTISMAEAGKLARENNLSTDFLQKVPVARTDGKDIVSEVGFDSPLLRYGLYKYAENRGIGTQRYYVVGWDVTTESPLASIRGHMGSVQNGRFQEIMTTEFYHNPATLLWDCQRTVLSYLEANDRLTGSSYLREVVTAFDEDGDGVITYEEMGREGYWQTMLRLVSYGMHVIGYEKDGAMRGYFLTNSLRLKYFRPEWNAEGHDFGKHWLPLFAVATAIRMSQQPWESQDPFHPDITWGNGKFPSLQLASYMLVANSIYGASFPFKVSAPSLYALAFQHADALYNGGRYIASGTEAIDRYMEAVAQGAAPLDFVLYVPQGFGNLAGRKVPNVEETTDPAKIFTVSFAGGREHW